MKYLIELLQQFPEDYIVSIGVDCLLVEHRTATSLNYATIKFYESPGNQSPNSKSLRDGA